MMTRKLGVFVCAAAMIVTSAIAASAGTIVTPVVSGGVTADVYNGYDNATFKWITGNWQTIKTVPFQLPKFDASLGTLTKVTVSFDVTSAHDYYYDFLHNAVITAFETDGGSWFSFYNRGVNLPHDTWATVPVNYTTPYIISQHGYPQHDTHDSVLTNPDYMPDYLQWFNGAPGDTFTVTGTFTHTLSHFDWHWADPTVNDNRYDLDTKMIFTYSAFATYEFDPATVPDPTQAPEPASLILLGTGLVGAVTARRKRRAQDEQK